ncbi:DoxX family protein [Halomarina ordinaria]|uniref:DoxX family protein n=1 Tax=Halomarina ordinaria TaxID=3033939 RepID=A0ABD5U6D9_9EURY|nr:DoxX family protein [Halomarina sp. PSRA2]
MLPLSLQTAPALDGPGAEFAFLLARVLFGGVLAFMGLNHLTGTGEMSGYAGAKGVPAPSLLVPFTGGMLLVGGLSIALGAYPLVGAGALAVFLLVTTPVMHDFWTAPEDQRQTETIQFLKNVGLLGGALVFLAFAGTAWPLSLGLAL